MERPVLVLRQLTNELPCDIGGDSALHAIFARNIRFQLQEILMQALGSEFQGPEPLKISFERFEARHTQQVEKWPKDTKRYLDQLLETADEFISRYENGPRKNAQGAIVDCHNESFDLVEAALNQMPQRLTHLLQDLPLKLFTDYSSINDSTEGKSPAHDFYPIHKPKGQDDSIDQSSDDELLANLLSETPKLKGKDQEPKEVKSEAVSEKQVEQEINQIDRLKIFFEKINGINKINDGPISISKVGSGSRPVTEEKHVIAHYTASPFLRFDKALATLAPMVVLPDGRTQDLLMMLLENGADRFHSISKVYKIRELPLPEAELLPNQVECVGNMGGEGFYQFPLTHAVTPVSACFELVDGSRVAVDEILECELGGIRFFGVAGAVKFILRSEVKQQSYRDELDQALAQLLPEAPNIFQEKIEIASLLQLIERKYIPQLVVDHLESQGLLYCLGPEIHEVIEQAGDNWPHFGLGFKAVGKCGQLSAVHTMALRNFGISALQIYGFNPKSGEICLEEGHAQVLCVINDTRTVIEATKNAKPCVLDLSETTPEEFAEALAPIKDSQPKEAQALGKSLNPKWVRDNLESLFPLGMSKELQEELDKNKEAQRNEGINNPPLPKDSNLDLMVLIKAASKLKLMNEEILVASKTGDLKAVDACLDGFNEMQVDHFNDSSCKIVRILPRVLLLNRAIEIFKKEAPDSPIRTKFLEKIVDLLAGIKILVGKGEYSRLHDGYLNSEHYSKVIYSGFLTQLSNRELLLFAEMIERTFKPAPEDKREANNIFSLKFGYGAEPVLQLGNAIFKEISKRSDLEVKLPFLVALTALNYVSTGYHDKKRDCAYNIFRSSGISSDENMAAKALATLMILGNVENLPGSFSEQFSDSTYYNQNPAFQRSGIVRLEFERHESIGVKSYRSLLSIEREYQRAIGPVQYRSAASQPLQEEVIKQIGILGSDLFDLYIKLLPFESEDTYSWSNRLLYWAKILGELPKYEGVDLRFKVPSAQLEELSSFIIKQQAKDASLEYLNPPSKNYPLSDHMMRGSQSLRKTLEACDSLIKLGAMRSYDEFMPSGPMREEAVFLKIISEVANNKSIHLFFDHTQEGEGNQRDFNRFNRGVAFAREAVRSENPRLASILDFINPDLRSDDLSDKIANIFPSETRLLVQEMALNFTSFRDHNELARLAASEMISCLGRQGIFPALLWAIQAKTKHTEAYYSAYQSIANLSKGLHSSKEELIAALGNSLSVMTEAQIGRFGELSYQSRIVGILLHEVFSSGDLDREYKDSNASLNDTFAYYIMPWETLRKRYLGICETQQIAELAVNPAELIKNLLCVDAPVLIKDKYGFGRKIVFETAMTLVKDAERFALKRINSFTDRTKGKGWVDYEETLKEQVSSRRSRFGVGEFDSVREYVNGDDVKRINQRLLARTDKLYVNNKVVKSDEPEIVIVLNAKYLDYKPALIGEAYSQIAIAAAKGMKKIDLAISIGEVLYRFENLSHKESDGKMRFRSESFKIEFAKAISALSQLESEPIRSMGSSVLGFVRGAKRNSRTCYLLVGDDRFNDALKADVKKISQKGSSVYSIFIGKVNQRFHNLHPKQAKAENRRLSQGSYGMRYLHDDSMYEEGGLEETLSFDTDDSDL